MGTCDEQFIFSMYYWRRCIRTKRSKAFLSLITFLFASVLFVYLDGSRLTSLSNEHYTSQTCHCGKVYISRRFRRDDKQTDWCSPESKVRGPGQQVISYTLYGNTTDSAVFKRYYTLIEKISQTAAQLYPGWIVRVYHDIDESEPVFQKMLCSSYCKHANLDLCNVPQLVKRIRAHPESAIESDQVGGLNPKMYRYLALLDPNVDVVISRDVDSVIRQREVTAVKQWLASNYTFHLMRDHTAHDVIILAGMLFLPRKAKFNIYSACRVALRN